MPVIQNEPGTLASSPTDIEDRSSGHLEWVQGRRSSLLAFAPDGRLVWLLTPGDWATPQEIATARLALAILNLTPVYEYLRRRSGGKRRADRTRAM